MHGNAASKVPLAILQANLRGPAPARVDPASLKPVGPGRPLSPPVLQKMEGLFGTRFRDVRVHVGPQAASIGARAFTTGSDIFFAPGEYNPSCPTGLRLLGHELTHVVQQRAGKVRSPHAFGVRLVQDPGLEAEAERMGLRAVGPDRRAGSPAPPAGQAGQATPHPARSAGDSPIQRKVGFEFQTNWRVEAAPLTGGSGRVVNVPVFKAVPLVQGVGWTLTSDGGEAEFVTEAFEETDNTRLRTVFASMIGYINSLKANRNGTQLMPLRSRQGVTWTGTLAALRPSQGGNVLAVPQMTAGIRIDQLRKAMKSTGTENQNDPRFGYTAGYDALLEEAADRTVRRRLNRTAGYRSVVSLMATYVALAANHSNGITAEGVKRITTLMSRSHLGQVFRQVTEYQRAQGNQVALQQLKQTFTTDVLQVAVDVSQTCGLQNTNSINGNLRMIPPMAHNGLPNASGPTVTQQLEGMVDGNDLLRWGWGALPNRWRAGGASMGNMGVERVGPGQGNQRGMGIIVEFRNFDGNLDSAQWSIWAESLMRWVVQVNNPAILQPGFQWRAGQNLPPAPQMPNPTSNWQKVAALGTLALAAGWAGYSYLSG